MTDREKLIELVNNVLRCLPWGEISSHTAEDVADHLVANGVTIATDNNVGDKSSPTTNADTCVCCGAIIPEGQIVCPNCLVTVKEG